jgi:hypothetical protein
MLSYVLISTVPRCSWTSRPVEFSEQVVFKALIVLHTMIRNGHTDNVLNYIASSDILRLRHVANGERHGERSYPITLRRGNYSTLVFAFRLSLPENLSNYAVYLETRARAYRDLKHDAIRVQSENNRDRRLSMAGGSGSGDGRQAMASPAGARPSWVASFE